MSRWSSEEDLSILETIQLLSEEPKYGELVEYHNNQFNKTRTELTYKARVNKIAKENDIKLTPSTKWSEEDKEYIKSIVKKNPFDIPWSEIGTHLNRSEERVKLRYLDYVNAEEHVDICIDVIDDSMINNLIENTKNTCSLCKCISFSNLQIWKENEYCEDCYEKNFGEEIKERWLIIHKYSIEQNKTSCNICSKQAVFDNKIISRFHYDHIDMFDKSNSICEMVRTGITISDIYKEIDKCQLICISCHKIITKMEHQCGFIRFKKQMTKDYNEADEIIKEEILKKYSLKYNMFMSKVYSLLKLYLSS